jgi:predicted anti-sigma-YlaC factor YlaD
MNRNCEELRNRMLDVAARLSGPTADETKHLASCEACREHLKSMRATMALLDEWQDPEPSPYFDVRLQARLREEMAKPPVSWLSWVRRPVLAAALTVLMGLGVGLLFTHGGGMHQSDEAAMIDAAPGTAVSDLQTLEANHDLYSDFELLDDLDLQQDVVANP